LLQVLRIRDSQAQWWSNARNYMDWVFMALYLSEFVLKIFADRLDFFRDGWCERIVRK
jgi:hypothetical protein